MGTATSKVLAKGMLTADSTLKAPNKKVLSPFFANQGNLIVDATDSLFKYYNGAAWVTAGSSIDTNRFLKKSDSLLIYSTITRLNDTAASLRSAISGGTVNPAGSDQEVQFNDNGVFGASADLMYDNATQKLTIGGSSSLGTLELGNANAGIITGGNGSDIQISSSATIAISGAEGVNINSVSDGTTITTGGASGFRTINRFGQLELSLGNASVTGNHQALSIYNDPDNLEMRTVLGSQYAGGASVFIEDDDITKTITFKNGTGNRFTVESGILTMYVGNVNIIKADSTAGGVSLIPTGAGAVRIGSDVDNGSGAALQVTGQQTITDVPDGLIDDDVLVYSASTTTVSKFKFVNTFTGTGTQQFSVAPRGMLWTVVFAPENDETIKIGTTDGDDDVLAPTVFTGGTITTVNITRTFSLDSFQSLFISGATGNVTYITRVY